MDILAVCLKSEILVVKAAGIKDQASALLHVVIMYCSSAGERTAV